MCTWKYLNPNTLFLRKKNLPKELFFKYEFQGSSVFSDLKIPKEEKSIDQKKPWLLFRKNWYLQLLNKLYDWLSFYDTFVCLSSALSSNLSSIAPIVPSRSDFMSWGIDNCNVYGNRIHSVKLLQSTWRVIPSNILDSH